MKELRGVGILVVIVTSVLGVLISCFSPFMQTGVWDSKSSNDLSLSIEPKTTGDPDSPLSVELYAGQTINVGMIDVWIDGDWLYVRYNIILSTWSLAETHLEVVADPKDFPKTDSGNPIPGHFTYKDTHPLGTSECTFSIDLADFVGVDTLFFAAHAELQQWADGVCVSEESAWAEGYAFSGANWATYFAVSIPKIPPPAKIVGTFAFSDETGRLDLVFPSMVAKGITRRAIQDIHGELRVNIEGGGLVVLFMSGTYDDSNGYISAVADRQVNGDIIEYTVEGFYNVESGFTGTITRTQDGETTTGTLGAIPDKTDDLGILVFTGVYGGVDKWEIWKVNFLTEEEPWWPPENTITKDFQLKDNRSMGAFCLTFSEELIVVIYQSYEEYDPETGSGAMFGQFTDPPFNTTFELRLAEDELTVINGAIDEGITFGTWSYEHWDEPFFDGQDWYNKRSTKDGTFEGTLVE